MNRILCCVVLYGRRAADSPALAAVLRQGGEAFVWDNSAEASPLEGVHYEHHGQNPGLGAAYNAAARYARSGGFDWLLMLDQDTTLPSDFLETFRRGIAENPGVELFVPEVFTGSEELSPLRRWKAQPRPLAVDRLYPVRHYLLINSGLCVRLAAFERAGGYNEAVWLDFSDMQFVRRLLHAGVSEFYLLNTRAEQDFSGRETDKAKYKARFRIYLDCARACEYLDFPDWAFRKHMTLVHTLSAVVRWRDASFLSLLLRRV